MEWSIDWTKYRINKFLTRQMSEEERRAVVIFASFHSNGYIRQRAVRALLDYPETLPFIALRFTDGVVTEVRREARQAFARRLPQATDQELLDTLTVIERVKGDPHSCISMLAPRLTQNAVLFDRILTDPEIRVRRFGISNIREFLPKDYGKALIDRLIEESDPFLRQLVLKTLLGSDQDLRPYYDILLRDKYPPNRQLTLLSLNDTDPTAGETMARTLLLDKNAHVRNVAKTIVRQHEPTFDFYGFYRDRVKECPAICLVEIAAAEKSEDAVWIEKFLKDPRPAVCRAAMAAVMRLDALHYAPRIMEMLASPQPGIVKTAAQLLHRYGLYDAERIFEIQRQSVFASTKLRCIPLLFATPKWKSLIYILRMLGTEGDKTNRLCGLYIDRWIKESNSSYLTITRTEQEEIQRLIAEKTDWLDEETVLYLQFVTR